MKNLFIFLVVAGLVSCKKEYSGPEIQQLIDVRFYSTNLLTVVKPVFIRINGNVVGKLNYGATVPNCGAANFSGLPLAGGVYTAERVDGNVITLVSFTVPKTAANCVFFDLK